MNSALRSYRLRIFDAQYELLPDRIFVTVLDLENPTSWPAVRSELNGQLMNLAEQARAAGEWVEHPRLQVHDLATGEKVFDWVGG